MGVNRGKVCNDSFSLSIWWNLNMLRDSLFEAYLKKQLA